MTAGSNEIKPSEMGEFYARGKREVSRNKMWLRSQCKKENKFFLRNITPYSSQKKKRQKDSIQNFLQLSSYTIFALLYAAVFLRKRRNTARLESNGELVARPNVK